MHARLLTGPFLFCWEPEASFFYPLYSILLKIWKASKMKCPKCQHENPEDAKYCQVCGNRLIVASEAVRASSLPDAERKRVTALFSDLSGYRRMINRLKPLKSLKPPSAAYVPMRRTRCFPLWRL
jgi:predicted amidophosphoribosyltransferase